MQTAKVIELHQRGRKFDITAVVRFKHGGLWNYLKSRQLSPKEFAEELGVHVHTVYRWLNMLSVPNAGHQESLPDGFFPQRYKKAVHNKQLNYGKVEVTRSIPLPSIGIKVQFNSIKQIKGGK